MNHTGKEILEEALPQSKNTEAFLSVIYKYSKVILYSVIALICLSLVAQYYFSLQKSSSEEDLLSLDHYIVQAKQDLESFDKVWPSISQTLVASPELYQRYSGTLSQSLIKYGKTNELATLQKHLGSFSSKNLDTFVQASLLIESGFPQKAVELSEDLKLELATYTDNLDMHLAYLEGYNLLRICFLYGKLEMQEKEKQAISHFFQKAQINKNEVSNATPKAIAQLISSFREGNLSLLDYLAYRKSL